MFKPAEDRLNYSHLLTPPEGYTVEFAAGTTYSLDLEALVGIPMSMFLSEEMESSFLENPIAVLEGLRRSADKFILFSEAGQTKVPQNSNLVFSLLETSVNEIALKSEKSFHPKIWLIKFKNESNEILYRLIVLTRNLTFDRSWDMAIALDGKMNKEKTSKNRPIADFFAFLLSYVNNNRQKKEINAMISDLAFVHFESKDKHFKNVDFLPLGLQEYNIAKTELFNTYHNLLVISPFLSKEMVEKLNEKALINSDRTLITRKSEISKLDEKLLGDINVYALKDIIVDGEENLSEGGEIIEDYYKQDIHAKMYARTKYNKHEFYIGSANCSHNAFNGNVEFLLKFDYVKRGFKLIDILKDLFGEEDSENPFEKIEAIPEEEETESDIMEMLQKTIKKLCRTNPKGKVRELNAGYDLEIRFDSVPKEAQLIIMPLLSGKERRVTPYTVINDLSLSELGEFYIVKAIKEEAEVKRVIKINTENMPEERDNDIYKRIIKDKHTFFKYVAFLLSDNALMAALEHGEIHKGAGKWEQSSFFMPVLYETMLKAASSSPEKLKDIESIVKMIQDDEIVPEEFYELYNTFLKAVKKVKR
ncbi:phospholipase D family protein [Salipaludibacillus sp. CUR1]|uniref:phospholipase D family protein n=1 Tax=Salipaludibacillus sp. CUR1 TaxID=2820003 RepID=UPI001E33A084|nr:phospholipase D family protein [Salipaludibacillus sp. CUR1]MCE7792205.1 phospholipase D family protein [Salipaludibacillus sp. CUR1]